MANTEANRSSRTKSKIKYNARNYERLYIQVIKNPLPLGMGVSVLFALKKQFLLSTKKPYF